MAEKDDYLYDKPENFYLRRDLRTLYEKFCTVEEPQDRVETFLTIVKDTFGLVEKPIQAEG